MDYCKLKYFRLIFEAVKAVVDKRFVCRAVALESGKGTQTRGGCKPEREQRWQPRYRNSKPGSEQPSSETRIALTRLQ